jgi:glycosyltransferase involved in cell wall biosynthesis
MNVWYICKYVSYPGHGYVGMRGFYLMQELSKLSCNVDLITSSSSSFLNKRITAETVNISPNFSFHQLTGRQFGNVGSIARIVSWIAFEAKVLLFSKKKLRRPDVIIVSSLSILSIINGFIWSKVYRAKLVFEVRDIWPLTLTEEGGFSKLNPFIVALGFLERWGYKVSDLIVGTMPNLEAHVSSVCKNETSKVICVPIGIPDDVSNPFFSAGVLRPKLRENKFIIGYVGTIGKTNALDTLFRALKRIDLVKENIECHLVGGGPLLEYYSEKYSHITNLSFIGHVEKESVAEIISSFDVVYFSTFQSAVWDYGQSLNKIIDYMLAGKPILGSYSGYPSMVNEANCGWFIPAEDSITLSAKIVALSVYDKEALAIIGRKGVTWIQNNRKYSSLASQFLDHIKEVVD